MISTIRALSTAASLVVLAGCSSHAYYNEAMRYMKSTKQVLIEEDLCSSEEDCSQKQMALWSAGGWKIGPIAGGGVTISVHNVPNLEIAAKIVARCRTLHAEMPEVPVEVTVYASAHIDNLHPGTPKVILSERIS